MGHVTRNDVRGARDASIYCGDHSICHIEDNRVVGGDGPSILAFWYSGAELDDNVIVGAPGPRHSDDSTFDRRH